MQRDKLAIVSFDPLPSGSCSLSITVDLFGIDMYLKSQTDAMTEMSKVVEKLRNSVIGLPPDTKPPASMPDRKELLMILQGGPGPLDPSALLSGLAWYIASNGNRAKSELLSALDALEGVFIGRNEVIIHGY